MCSHTDWLNSKEVDLTGSLNRDAGGLTGSREAKQEAEWNVGGVTACREV